MLTSLRQALPRQNWKNTLLTKTSSANNIYQRSIMSFTTTFKKSKCIKCLLDKFVSKSKLHAQNQNGKYSRNLSWNNKSQAVNILQPFFNLNYSIKTYSLSTKYSVSYRGLTQWNTSLDKRDKKIESHLLFEKKIKSKLLDITNECFFKK